MTEFDPQTIKPRRRPRRPRLGPGPAHLEPHGRPAPGGDRLRRERGSILPADVCSRLEEVKRTWDPENRIVANHGVKLEA